MAANLVLWRGQQVPPHVLEALQQQYRGQRNIGAKAKTILGFYSEEPLLKAPVGAGVLAPLPQQEPRARRRHGGSRRRPAPRPHAHVGPLLV